MEKLPDHLVWDIFGWITKSVDRNSASLTCKRLYQMDNEQRRSLRVECGLDPAGEALTCLCNRFPNLTTVEIHGKQMDNQCLAILSNYCHSLTDLTLSNCISISDVGLRHLVSCSKLKVLKLNFLPRITDSGFLYVVVGCKNLSTLHLIGCVNVTNVEWLKHLGKHEMLEDLLIKNCRAIGEDDLLQLGPGWRKLKRFQFEANPKRHMKVYDRLALDRLQKQCVPCQNLTELTLVNCNISSGRGLACVLGTCKNLEKIHLDMCVGVTDPVITNLARKSRNLRSISLRVPIPSFGLSDESLKCIAQHCLMLESVRISFYGGEFPPFLLNGILTLIQMCPIRELALDKVYSFDDIGMEALCSTQYLEILELVKCQEISDEGMELVSQFPHLRVLRLIKCWGVTDDGLKPLMGSYKLDLLAVEGCPQISKRGVQGAAKSVSFQQDLGV